MSFERTITYNGETLTVADWARRTGLKDKTIYARMDAGWMPDKILEKPLQNLRFCKDPGFLKTKKAEKLFLEERKLVRSYLKTQPSWIDERREEGNIL